VVEDCNDHGPTRIQTNYLKRDILNMKLLLTDDEFYTPEEVKGIIDEDNANYKGQTEKTLCRLYTFGEGNANKSDLFLLPWCIDKWRLFVKERKAFKFWLRFMEKKTSSTHSTR
jgi:hypothetical protein